MTDINPYFDDPDGYDDDQSYDDGGKLPPDWGAREAAVRERQNGRCVTCGRASEFLYVHHIRAPPGGDHRLTNLIGRCRSCADRDKFVTTVRVPTTGSGWKADARPDRPFSQTVFVGGILVLGLAYLVTLYSTAGPQAPAGPTAYVVWLVNQQVDAFIGFIRPIVNFIAIVLFVILFAQWFADA